MLCYIFRNLFSGFSENEFSQDCSGHYSVKFHVWEKVQLLSYGLKTYRPIRFYDIFKCSFILISWLFGMIMINISSVLEVFPSVLKIKKQFLLLVIVYRVTGPVGTFTDDFMLLISEQPTQHRILIVGDFNHDQMFLENVAKVDVLIQNFNLSQRSQ